MQRRPFIVFLAALVISSGPAFAQKMPVFLAQTTRDDVGGRLAFAIKEGIRRSASMQLADRQQDARLSVMLVTINPDQSRGQEWQTVYSVVWTVETFHNPPVTMYLTNSVGTCGSARLQ
jgi:hypothetical protein